MELGIHVVEYNWAGGSAGMARRLSAIARAAEEVGCQHISVMDHYFQIGIVGPPEDPMLEAYSTLGFLAAVTSRIKLHVLVTGVTYRHPGLLAKIVTTVDVLSGGRAELAIGAAWNEQEHRGLGVPFPPVAERFERLEETLQICLQMWSENDGPFRGNHYRLDETICSPRPLTAPHPPIVIGGGGERKTLKLVARYADGSNLFGSSRDDVAHKLDVLRRHCDDAGRDYDEITKSVLYFGGWPVPDGFVEEMKGFKALGVDTVVVMPRGPDPVKDIQALGPEVIGALAAL